MTSMDDSSARVAEIVMPRLSDTMEEATIAAWLKRPGDSFARGEGLVEVETDKATIVYEADSDGVLIEVLVAEGESAPLGAPIARASRVGTAVSGAEAKAAPVSRSSDRSRPAPARPRSSRPPATPAARRLAEELGVGLVGVTGTGPGGRIVRADVLQSETPRRPDAVPGDDDRRVSLTTTQRTIARRVAEAHATVPDFTLTAELDVTAALALRRDLTEVVRDARVSVNDLFVKAAAIALRDLPRLNASYVGETLIEHARVNVGIVVAADDALRIPVIRDADRRSLIEIAHATHAAAERARTHALTPPELEGGTFTISNLGMYGVSNFQAVINAPQVAILAIGRADRRPAFDDAGAVVAREVVEVSLSCDHRAVYGVDAARFLERVGRALERPLELVGPIASMERGDHGPA